MLSVEKLQFAYGDLQVLWGIDLEVKAGEIVTVVGANGAGKSTVLKNVSRLVRPKSGRILFDGEDLGGLHSHQVVERGVVQVPEGRRIFPWRDLTEGMQGILIIQTFRSKIPYYYLALFLAAACVYAIYRVINSKWGFYFVAIREDEDAAESMGISGFRYKSLSLAVSSFFTGLAGAFYMNYMAFIDPHVVFSLHYISIMAILVGIIGGVGTLWGPPAGAFIMVLLQETFRSSFFGLLPKWVSEGHVLVFGLLVIFVIRFMANGIIGDWHKIRQFWSKAKPLPPATAGN